MLTYLSDNDQKRKSFSSEGSDTPEENLRHRGVVLNVNNLFGLQKFNKPISPHLTSDNLAVFSDCNDPINNIPMRLENGSMLKRTINRDNVINISSFNDKSD